MANHQFNVPFAMQDDPMAFVEGLNDGSPAWSATSTSRIWRTLINLVKNNTGNPPLTEDHHMQVSLFASEDSRHDSAGQLERGRYPGCKSRYRDGPGALALGDDPAKSGRIPVGIPWYWVVTEDSAVKEKPSSSSTGS